MSQSATLNSSTTSSQINSNEDAKIVPVKNYAKELLKSRIFLGRYLERRLVDNRIGYRDIVLVSAAEVEFKRDLILAQQELRSVYPAQHWIGITDSDILSYISDDVCIWTEIDNQPLGPFWFQVKSLKFRDAEIIVALKCLRHISDAFLEVEPILTGAVKKTNGDTSIATVQETWTDVLETLKSALTFNNIKELFTFIFALIIAIFVGGASFLHFIGDFVLALVREMSLFVKNSTPMFLGVLDFFSKIVGGFYILLAMIFRQTVPPPTNARSVAYYDKSHKSNDYYDSNQFD